MLTSLPAAIAAEAGSAILVITCLLSFLAPYIQDIPGLRSSQIYYARFMQAANFLLNLAAIVGVEVLMHQFTWQYWYADLLLAGFQGVLGHAAFALHSSAVNARNQKTAQTAPQPWPAPVLEDGRSVEKLGVL